MQTTTTAPVSPVVAIEAATAAPAKAKAKRVRVAKPATVKADAKPEAPAKPDTSAKRAAAEAKQAERANAIDARREARKLAADAVSTYYSGASLPFKASADRFSDLRLDKTPKRATQRQAALLASMLLAGDNIKPDGTFTRGAFELDGKRVQPETGALSDMLGRVVSYVSGPTSGAGQSDTVLRIDLKRAQAEIRELIGGKLASAALKRLDSFGIKA